MKVDGSMTLAEVKSLCERYHNISCSLCPMAIICNDCIEPYEWGLTGAIHEQSAESETSKIGPTDETETSEEDLNLSLW